MCKFRNAARIVSCVRFTNHSFGNAKGRRWLSDHYQPDWQEVLEQAEIFDDHVDVIEFIKGASVSLFCTRVE